MKAQHGKHADCIVVAGGAGFIGSNFVRLVMARTNARVVVIDKLTYAGNLRNLEDVVIDQRFNFIKADITDRHVVDGMYRDHHPTWVVNLAAESHVDRSIDGPRAFLRTNTVGSFELLDASREYLAGLDQAVRNRFRFLHVSTDEVYGTLGPTGLFAEETAYAPNSPYAASKAAADHFVRAFQETYALPTLVTNCSNNYGPFQFPEKLIPLTILNAIEGQALPLYGDGGNVRDWLHVEDHCAAILLLLQRGRIGEKYNIGGNDERRNVEIVERICAVLEELLPAGKNPALAGRGIKHYADLKSFVPDRPGHDRRYAVDSSKIRQELGWKPRYDLDSGMRETVRWYLEHREWCAAIQISGYQRQRLGIGGQRG